jgi:hypothetical protein
MSFPSRAVQINLALYIYFKYFEGINRAKIRCRNNVGKSLSQFSTSLTVAASVYTSGKVLPITGHEGPEVE